MKVLIATDILHTIHCDVILHIEDLGFRVLVKEIGLATQASLVVQSSKSPSTLEAMDSNGGVLDFEDIDDGTTSEAEGESKRHGIRDKEAAINHEVANVTFNR